MCEVLHCETERFRRCRETSILLRRSGETEVSSPAMRLTSASNQVSFDLSNGGYCNADAATIVCELPELRMGRGQTGRLRRRKQRCAGRLQRGNSRSEQFHRVRGLASQARELARQPCASSFPID